MTAECVSECETAGASRPARLLLDQERDNRFTPNTGWVAEVPEGAVMLSPSRSGGGLDPLGKRSVDFWKADDLLSVVEVLGGRWIMVTLTIDRSLWISPGAAYQRCNERVRKVLKCFPRGVWFAGLELQTKTGDGWPHWHALVWLPGETRTDHQLQAAIERKWRVVTEHIDEETGEVTRSVERIGFVHVTTAKDRIGCGKYIAKYITKRWDAVPDWMGSSSRRWRLMRFSGGAYDVLERVGRHVRHRGGRRPRNGRARPARRLFERMARSGSALNGFLRLADGWKYLGTVHAPVTVLADEASRFGARVVRLGEWGKVRGAIDVEGFEAFKRAARDGEFNEARAAYLADRLRQQQQAWDWMQHNRAQQEGEA